MHIPKQAFLSIISTHAKLTYNISMKFSPMSDAFDEYSEIHQANLDISIRRRHFVEVPIFMS
jgi:hypothetical protein